MDTEYNHVNTDELVIHRTGSDGSVLDSMVDATKRSTSWVVDSCGMCTHYMDKQVQYEVMAHRFQGAAEAANAATSTFRGSETFDLQAAIGACKRNFEDIKATANMMFDEQSVVDSVDTR